MVKNAPIIYTFMISRGHDGKRNWLFAIIFEEILKTPIGMKP